MFLSRAFVERARDRYLNNSVSKSLILVTKHQSKACQFQLYSAYLAGCIWKKKKIYIYIYIYIYNKAGYEIYI